MIIHIKQKCGIIERENYNKAKSADTKHPMHIEEFGEGGNIKSLDRIV